MYFSVSFHNGLYSSLSDKKPRNVSISKMGGCVIIVQTIYTVWRGNICRPQFPKISSIWLNVYILSSVYMHLYFYIQCHCKFNPSRSSKITSKQPRLLKTLNFSFIFPFLKFRNFYLNPLPPLIPRAKRYGEIRIKRPPPYVTSVILIKIYFN